MIGQGRAGLSAAFLSDFLIELLSRFEPDPIDIIQDILVYEMQMMRNSSLGPYVPGDFSPPDYCYFQCSLLYRSKNYARIGVYRRAHQKPDTRI